MPLGAFSWRGSGEPGAHSPALAGAAGLLETTHRLRLVLLAGMALAVYANTLGHGFVYDDFWLVVDNPLIRRLDNFHQLFTSGYLRNRIYRPLTLFSFSLDYALVGLHPLLYHAGNVALHAAITLVVFLVLRPIARQTAWLAAALFAVLPVHTEVVASIASRSELLATLLGLLALWQIRRPVYAGTLLMLGLLAKESAIAIPGLALLLWWRQADRPAGRRMALEIGALGLGAGAYLLLHHLVRGSVFLAWDVLYEIDNPLALAEWPARVRTALMILGQNLALCFVPYHFSADYSFPQIPLVTRWTDLRFLLWTAFPIAAVSGALAVRRAHPNLARGLAWFLVAVAPVSNLVVTIGTIRAERLLYLPSVGICLVLAEGLGMLMLARRRAAVALAALLLVTFAAVAVRRNLVWRNQQTLVTAMVADAPRSSRAHYLLAERRVEAGDCPAALPGFRRALELAPDLWMARLKMSACLEKMGDLAAAAQGYRQLVAGDPSDILFAEMLARLCTKRNDWRCVAETTERLLAANRDAARLPATWVNLGNALLQCNELDQAEAAYRRAIALGGMAVGHFNLAGILVRRGRFHEAVAQYRAAELMGMNREELYLDLAAAQQQAGDAPAARLTAARGLKRFPSSQALQKLTR